MALTKTDKELLHILVQKEINEMKADAKKLMIVNAEYITTSKDNSDLEFLKAEEKYEEILQKLLKKL
ncbi:hypothetical protein CL619_00900 [archaeon]|nr:hypothetical protein [archaeon]